MGEGFHLRRIFVGNAVCGQKLIRYYLLEYDTAGRACYGIQVEVGREKTVIPRITPSQVAVLALAERLIRGCVTPVTARDVVEDWLLT